jgi:choline dehydrogenase-like flavoprotein
LAGSLLAGQLSENSNVKVLLIEAGGSNENIEITEIPFLAPELAAPYVLPSTKHSPMTLR